MEPSEQLIPLVELEFSLDPPSFVGGWHVYLASHGVAVVADDVGRPAVARSAARMLIAEQREREARGREKPAELERQAVEADQQRRAALYAGISANAIPEGVHPSAAMLAAVHDARPRRVTPLQEALAGESLTFHPVTSVDFNLSGTVTTTSQCFTKSGNPVNGVPKSETVNVNATGTFPVRNGQTTGSLTIATVHAHLYRQPACRNPVRRV